MKRHLILGSAGFLLLAAAACNQSPAREQEEARNAQQRADEKSNQFRMQAEDLIAYAEESAERVTEEAEAAKAEAAEHPENKEARAGRGTSAASHLFKEQAETTTLPKPTMESIFGPDTQEAAPTEEPAISIEQVFGEPPPPQPDVEAEKAPE